jgi:hypothetical protein
MHTDRVREMKKGNVLALHKICIFEINKKDLNFFFSMLLLAEPSFPASWQSFCRTRFHLRNKKLLCLKETR